MKEKNSSYLHFSFHMINQATLQEPKCRTVQTRLASSLFYFYCNSPQIYINRISFLCGNTDSPQYLLNIDYFTWAICFRSYRSPPCKHNLSCGIRGSASRVLASDIAKHSQYSQNRMHRRIRTSKFTESQ